MRTQLQWIVLILEWTRLFAKEPELPLCPTNVQYFPQNLPMHCRMPTPADLHNIQNIQTQTFPPFPPSLFQNPQLDKQPGAIPLPIPPGMPGPLPGPMAGPMQIPMPMPVPGAPNPAHKLPVIVMPFYSPDNSFKKPQQIQPEPRPKFRIRKRRRPRYYSDTDDSSDTDTSSNELTDSSTEDESFWRGRRNSRRSNRHHREKRRRHQRHELLTPILQYVTKEGYVIFEKKISKGEAKDWLKNKNSDKIESSTRMKQEIDEFDEVEDGEVRFEKEEEKVEIKTEKNPKKAHKKKLKYKMPKKE